MTHTEAVEAARTLAVELRRDAILSILSLRALCDAWRETESRPMTPVLADVRGWLMEELERRGEAAFVAWIDSCQGVPDSFFGV